jgi:hypothetical protein
MAILGSNSPAPLTRIADRGVSSWCRGLLCLRADVRYFLCSLVSVAMFVACSDPAIVQGSVDNGNIDGTALDGGVDDALLVDNVADTSTKDTAEEEGAFGPPCTCHSTVSKG